MAKGSLRTIGTGSVWLAVMLAAGAVQAQDTTTVGNPQLKDFQLPGTRTTPPASPQQQPAPTDTTAPPVVLPPGTPLPSTSTTVTPPPATPLPAVEETPAEARSRPTRREPASAAPRATTPAAEAPMAAPVPSEVAPAPAEGAQAPTAPPAATRSTTWEPTKSVPGSKSRTPWLYIGLGALLALLALAGLIAFRRSRASAEDFAEAQALEVPAEREPERPPEPDPLFANRSAAAPAPTVEWLPSPAAAARENDVAEVSMRPRLELEFKADRAAATLTDASVQYELTIRNVGDAPARNVRIQPNMFNAGWEQEKEISDFFALPVKEDEPVAFSSFAPGADANLKASIRLPREELREITVEGRRLFIPIVAFNVYYEWGDGRSGQTSVSYLVGREAPSPQDKMGAFRLDLGPRLYRSVGQRQASLAKVV